LLEFFFVQKLLSKWGSLKFIFLKQTRMEENKKGRKGDRKVTCKKERKKE
jgi:hypothetical protein